MRHRIYHSVSIIFFFSHVYILFVCSTNLIIKLIQLLNNIEDLVHLFMHIFYIHFDHKYYHMILLAIISY